jgi:hypothetical protein
VTPACRYYCLVTSRHALLMLKLGTTRGGIGFEVFHVRSVKVFESQPYCIATWRRRSGHSRRRHTRGGRDNLSGKVRGPTVPIWWTQTRYGRAGNFSMCARPGIESRSKSSSHSTERRIPAHHCLWRRSCVRNRLQRAEYIRWN